MQKIDIVTREQAAALGKTRYYTGKPCKRGHIDWRFVCNTACMSCTNPYRKNVRNGITSELVNYTPHRLWVPAAYTLEQYRALDVYLQQCVQVHAEALGVHVDPELYARSVS